MKNPVKWQDPKKSLPKEDFLILVIAGPKQGNIKNHNYRSRIYTGSFSAFDQGQTHCWGVDGAGIILPKNENERWKVYAWAYLPGYDPDSPRTFVNPVVDIPDQT